MFYVGYCLAGIGFGGVWPLMVTLSADLWGLEHLGANYMVFDGTSALIGSLLCGKMLPQAEYVAHETKGNTNCSGSECFGAAHLMMASLNVVGVLAALVLWWRRRKGSDEMYA